MSFDEDRDDPLDQNDSALMAMNGLKYAMPQPLSVAVNRTFKRQYSQRQDYAPGQTMVFDINSGSDYIDPSSCNLNFDVTFKTTTTPTAGDVIGFGTGAGAASLIEEIRIISKNGTEIDRTQNANVLAKIMADYVYSADGQVMLENAGYNQTATAGGSGVFTAVKYTIPMSLISGFFRPTVKGMKIPAGLASGLRIELVLASAARALELTPATSASGVGYDVTDPVMLFSSVSLNDPTQSVLMTESAKSGLEYTYPSYFDTPVGLGTGLQINEQVKKAVSQATRVFATVYNTSGGAAVGNELYDGFQSIPSSQFANYQYRVGSSYYPQQTVDSVSEAIYVTNATFDKMRDDRVNPNSVTLSEYTTGGKFLIGHPLETDDRLNLSGIPLNNSNVLELRATLGSAGGADRELLIFTEFISVSKTRINSTDLKI
jgi:hypothetical protein